MIQEEMELLEQRFSYLWLFIHSSLHPQHSENTAVLPVNHYPFRCFHSSSQTLPSLPPFTLLLMLSAGKVSAHVFSQLLSTTLKVSHFLHLPGAQKGVLKYKAAIFFFFNQI